MCCFFCFTYFPFWFSVILTSAQIEKRKKSLKQEGANRWQQESVRERKGEIVREKGRVQNVNMRKQQRVKHIVFSDIKGWKI